MIDVKEAIQIAKTKAAEMLQEISPSVEEIERDVYKNRDVWSITLAVSRNPKHVSSLIQPINYKRFLIDSESGELLAIKLRELSTQ